MLFPASPLLQTAAQLDQATKVLELDAYPNLDTLTHKVGPGSISLDLLRTMR